MRQAIRDRWNAQQNIALPAEEDNGPGVAEAVAQDGFTRVVILGVLKGAEEVNLKFVEVITSEITEEERQRCLAWLVSTGCIAEHRRWRRNFFWEQRREVASFGITHVGTNLFNQIKTAMQEGRVTLIPPEGLKLPTYMPLPAWHRYVRIFLLVIIASLALWVSIQLMLTVFSGKW